MFGLIHSVLQAQTFADQTAIEIGKSAFPVNLFTWKVAVRIRACEFEVLMIWDPNAKELIPCFTAADEFVGSRFDFCLVYPVFTSATL